jgi:hypothetical protein
LGLGAACGEPPVAPAVPAGLVLTASDTIRAAGGTLTFTATAVDSGGQPVADVPILWGVSDTTRGRITATGRFTAGPDSGRVYVRATAGFTSVRDSVAVAVKQPGTVRWSWAASDVGGFMPNLGGPALATDGTVYVLVWNARATDFYPGTLVALDPGGVLRWSLPLDAVAGSTGPVVVPGSNRIWVVGEGVYLVSPGGQVLWDTTSDPEAAPDFLSGAATDNVLIAAQGKYLVAYDATTQAVRWQSQEAPLISWLVPPTITATGDVLAKLTDDTLFQFAGTDGGIVRFFLDPDTALDKRVFGVGTVPVGGRYYLPTTKRLSAYDANGPLLWLSEDTGRGVSEPAVGSDGSLYVQTRIHGLWALNPDGSPRWERPEVQPWSSAQGGVALAAGGIIYAGGTDAFYAFDLSGTLLWRFVADTALDGDGFPLGRFPGSPAIGPDGTVYTFTSTHMYAFWASAPPEPNSPWPMWRHDAQRTGWAR